MGQIFGKASLPRHCKRFSDLPRSRIYDIWQAYSEFSEVFSLSLSELQEIISKALLAYFSISEELLKEETEIVFDMFDTDKNGLIDSLEFLAAIAILSGMTPDEKITFIFAMFDFDESFELSPIETTLAFQCALNGLSKLTDVVPPLESHIEEAVVQGYARFFSARTGRINEFADETGGDEEVDIMDEGLKKEPFTKFCLDTPEIVAWIDFFDDLHVEGEDESLDLTSPSGEDPRPRATPKRHFIPKHYRRTMFQTELMNPSVATKESCNPHVSEAARSGTWRDTLSSFLTPSHDPEEEEEFADLPAESMTLDWAYGFNGHSTRQTLYYSARGALIYPAGAVVVIHDVAHKKQQHFTCHNDLVTCLKVYYDSEGGTIVASGECGRRPAVIVWDCETKKVLSALRGFHSNAIIQLDFSPDRTKLVTLGMDTYYCLAVYDWRNGVRLWSARTSLDVVYDVHFLSDRLIASCGKDHVTFWSQKEGGTFARFRGLFGSVAKKETMWCVSSIGDNVVTGSESGMIYMWEGRNLVRGIKAHEGRVNAMYLVNHRDEEAGLVTVCSAGIILIWNSQIEIRAKFNTNLLQPIERSIVSVCWDTVMQKLLLGFRSCEIFEVSSIDGRNAHFTSVVAAHYEVNVMHVAAHPTRPEIFCSVGADRSVRIFEMKLKKQLCIRLFDCMVKCATFSPDGRMLFIGFGSGIDGLEENKEGAFLVMNPYDLSTICDGKDTNKQITDIKVDPNGETFAVSSLDGAVYIYDLDDFSMRSNCRGHRGGVIHIDYSEDGGYLRSNCTRGDLVYWDVRTGFIVPPKKMTHVMWETQTCTFTFETKGMFSHEGIEYNAVCRSNSQKVIASVDNCGFVKLFPNPSLRENPSYYQAKAHAANAMCVAFTCNDAYLLSTGGLDGCVFQWVVNSPEDEEWNDIAAESAVSVNISHLYAEMSFEGKALVRSRAVEDMMSDCMEKVCEYEETSDARQQKSEWQHTLVYPSIIPVEDNSEPAQFLELELVCGFSCDRSRDSLKYSASGDIAFLSAAVGVLMSPDSHQQSFYMNHASIITAMAIHPKESIIATGELGESPAVHVWNSDTKATIIVLEGFHRCVIHNLAFSGDGSMLAVVGGDVHHTMTLYNWKYGQVIAQSHTMEVKSFHLAFSRHSGEIVQCGDGVVRFWSVDGFNMRFQDGLLIGSAKPQPFLCVAWKDDGNAIVGTADGHLYVFENNNVKSVIPAHNGTVTAVCSADDMVVSGGSDGVVKIWSQSNMDCIREIDIKSLSKGFGLCDVRCIDVCLAKGTVLVGTLAKEIFELKLSTGADVHSGPLMEGHSGEELWGLDAHPSTGQYCTAGDDGNVKIWTTGNAYSDLSIMLDASVRCCSFSPHGDAIAVGTVKIVFNGDDEEQQITVTILNVMGSERHGTVAQEPDDSPESVALEGDAGGSESGNCPDSSSLEPPEVVDRVSAQKQELEVVHVVKSITSMITVVKFSPDGKFLAVGCLEGTIHLLAVDQQYALVYTFKEALGYIAHIDFSVDSLFISADCGDRDHAFYNCSTQAKVDDASQVCDVLWATHTCCATWFAQGAWSPYEDGANIVCSSCDTSAVVTGDNYGRIQVFRYPVLSNLAVSKKYKVSSNAITNLCFVRGGSHLVSMSGRDNAIMLWRLAHDENVSVNAPNGEMLPDEEVTAVCTAHNAALFHSVVADGLETQEDTKMWLMTLIEPSDTSVADSLEHLKPPLISAELSHTFGLGAKSMRGMVRYNLDGDIVYPCSRYINVYNKKTNTQKMYREHTNEISCFTVSFDGKIAASVEECSRPSVRLWDACTTRIVKVLPVFHRRGVSSLQFSSDNKMLLSVGIDQDRSIALWESLTGQWTDARLKAWNKGGIQPVAFTSFYFQDSFTFVSGGEAHIKFWNVSGRCLNSINAVYNGKDSGAGNVICGESMGRFFVSGSSTGKVHVWNGKHLDRVIFAHTSAVRSMWCDGSTLVTGSKDGSAKIWNTDFVLMKTLSLADTDIPSLSHSLVSVDCVTDRSTNSGISTMLLATSGGDICEVSVYSESITLIQESHAIGELWGLAMHPFDPDLFATSGDDCTVRIWSISHKRVLRKAVLDCSSRCVSWSPDGKLLIVGLGGCVGGDRQRKDGGFVVFEASSLSPIFEGRDAKGWITDVKFNPVGPSFAVGSMDNKIYIYNRDRMRLKGTCNRHNGYIREIDYSEDGKYIQSDAGDYEKLFFEAEDGEYFTGSSFLKDVRWVNGSSVFGWQVLGVWPYDEDVASGAAAEPSCMQRSPDDQLIVAGDATGLLRIHRYPCVRKESEALAIPAHIGEISKVRFTCDNSFIVSVGKSDNTILLWKVDKK